MRPPASGRWQRPIFVINLKQDTERLAFMRKQLDDMNLEFELIEAVDGNSISEADRQKMTVGSLQPINAGELGCYLSHRKAYKAMVSRNIPEAMIIEDDVLLNDDFPAVFQGCELPEECQILQLVGKGDYLLSSLRNYCSSLALPLPRGYRMSPRIGTLWGAHGYIIRLHYARQLAQNMFPMKVRNDHILFTWQHCLYLPWIAYKEDTASRYGVQVLGKEYSATNKQSSANRDDREKRRYAYTFESIRQTGGKMPPRARERPLPVFVLNLEQDAQRMAALKQWFEAGNIPFAVVTAPDEKQVSARISANGRPAKDSRGKSPAIISPDDARRCLAHLAAYQEALKTGAPEALILEDHASLGEDFPAWFHGGSEGYRMANMIAWQPDPLISKRYSSPYRVKSLASKGKYSILGFRGLRRIYENISKQYAQAYIIRRSQMQKLLKRKETVDAPIDTLLFRSKKVTTFRDIMRELFGVVAQFGLLRWPWMLNHGKKVQLCMLEDRHIALRYLKTIVSLYSRPKPFGIKPPANSSGHRDASSNNHGMPPDQNPGVNSIR